MPESFVMDERQEALLRRAMYEWRTSSSWGDKAVQSDNCVLCKAYVRVSKDKHGTVSLCGKCPVYQFTGKEACVGTPAASPPMNASFSSRRRSVIDFGNKVLTTAGLEPMKLNGKGSDAADESGSKLS